VSHIHFVSNEEAAKRLKQMGEIKESILHCGSPDIDIMFSEASSLTTCFKTIELDFNALPSPCFICDYREVDKMESLR
jgi:UDP-N-acetylglucosamine 2-epimerase (hydrolysing)